MADKRRTENNSCNVLFLPSLMVCYNWHTDLCTIMPGWTVCYGFPKDFLWELLWNILTPKLWSMLKLILFYLFESKNSCLPMLAGNVKKMLAWKKKAHHSTTTTKKTFQTSKRLDTPICSSWILHENKKELHIRGLILHIFKSLGIFSVTWMGQRSSPGSIAGQPLGHEVLIVSPVSFLK